MISVSRELAVVGPPERIPANLDSNPLVSLVNSVIFSKFGFLPSDWTWWSTASSFLILMVRMSPVSFLLFCLFRIKNTKPISLVDSVGERTYW